MKARQPLEVAGLAVPSFLPLTCPTEFWDTLQVRGCLWLTFPGFALNTAGLGVTLAALSFLRAFGKILKNAACYHLPRTC